MAGRWLGRRKDGCVLVAGREEEEEEEGGTRVLEETKHDRGIQTGEKDVAAVAGGWMLDTMYYSYIQGRGRRCCNGQCVRRQNTRAHIHIHTPTHR